MTLGARAADSRYRVREELATFRVQDKAARRPRLSWARPYRQLPQPVVVTPRDRAAENAIVRIVAVTEAFVFGLLLDSTEPQLPRDALIEKLWENQIRAALNWEGRLDTWRDLHQINVRKSSEYVQFRSFIDARNAIAHGLGALTWHQLQAKANLPAALKAVDIDVRGNRLVLTSLAVEKCADRAVQLIRFLDTAAPRVPARPV